MGILADRLFGALRSETARTGISPVMAQMPGLLDERRAKIIRQWAYYHGVDQGSGKSQWDYLYERFETMPRREIEDIENHVRVVTDRLRRLLVGSWRGFEFEQPEMDIDGISGHDSSDTTRRLNEIFERNRWPRLLSLAVLYGQVTGDVFIRLVPAGPESPFAPLRLVLLDSESVELSVNPHDRDELSVFTVSYACFEPDSAGVMRRIHYREHIDRDRVEVFVDGSHVPEKSYTHGLGMLPLVHIRNLDTGGCIYGESLVERLIGAQDAINLLACDLMDIVRYDGHKTTIFQNVVIDKGASRDGETSGEIDLSVGKGLAVRGDGKVYKLEQQHDLGAALEEYERKLDAFYDLAGVPRLSRDLARGLGSLSGRAVERLYQDAVDSTREAQLIYGDGFRELAEKAALMAGLGPVRVRTNWNRDVIAPDIEMLEKEYALGVRSRRSVMRKLGIAEIDSMLRERAEEGVGDPL